MYWGASGPHPGDRTPGRPRQTPASPRLPSEGISRDIVFFPWAGGWGGWGAAGRGGFRSLSFRGPLVTRHSDTQGVFACGKIPTVHFFLKRVASKKWTVGKSDLPRFNDHFRNGSKRARRREPHPDPNRANSEVQKSGHFLSSRIEATFQVPEM